jgi:hypothetical protein
LSASRADVKAAKVTADATRETGSKLGGALDGVVAALIGAVTAALHDRIDTAVKDVVTSIRGSAGTGTTKSIGSPDLSREAPMRAD